MKTMTRRTFPILIALALTFALAATAFAQTPYDEDNPPAVSCSAEQAAAGDTIECEVTGLFPLEAFSWIAEYNPTVAEGDGVADEAGSAAFDFEVTEDAAGETITVTVTGEQSGVLTAEIEVVEDEPVTDDDVADDEDELPQTGAETILYVLGGLLLVGIGGAALLMARRRDRSTVGV